MSPSTALPNGREYFADGSYLHNGHIYVPDEVFANWQEDRAESMSAKPHTNGKGPSYVVCAEDIKSTTPTWAWKDRLPLGYLVVQSGIEGLGKSTFAAWMIAQLTHGKLEGDLYGHPSNALILAGEDNLEDSWKPRLDLAGANMSRTHFLNFDELPFDWNIRDGIAVLERVVQRINPRILFVDAVLDHLPQGESLNNPAFIRESFKPLKRLARQAYFVGAYSMHPAKAKGTEFRTAVQNSQAFVAIPRVGLEFDWHPIDPASMPDYMRRRVLLRGKGNIGRQPSALEFRIEGRSYTDSKGKTSEREVVSSVKPCNVTKLDLNAVAFAPKTVRRTKPDRIGEILKYELSDYEWHDSKPIRDRLQRIGLNSSDALNEAKDRLGIETRKKPGVRDGGWQMRLKGDSAASLATPLVSSGTDSSILGVDTGDASGGGHAVVSDSSTNGAHADDDGY